MVAPDNMQIKLDATVPRRVTGHSSENAIPAVGNAVINTPSQQAMAIVTSHVIPGDRTPVANANAVVQISENAVEPAIAAASTATA